MLSFLVYNNPTSPSVRKVVSKYNIFDKWKPITNRYDVIGFLYSEN